jgi:hypothetical protein
LPGIALFRAHVLARWAAALLAVGTAATVALAVLPASFNRPLAVPTGVALIGLGISLWRDQRKTAPEAAPATRIWVAEPLGRRVLRIENGGIVTQVFDFEQHPLAVCLGGHDRRTLFICLAGQRDKSTRSPEALASIVSMRVDTPGLGVS